MSQLGSLGPIVFIVSPNKIRTFDEFSRSSAGRWAKHDILGKKPLTQRIGPGLDTVSFSMRFDVKYGMNPRKELERLEKIDREGKALPFLIGGKSIGTGLWVITSLEQKWTSVDNNGNILVAAVNVSLEEYVK